jgi:hypothetical protein
LPTAIVRDGEQRDPRRLGAPGRHHFFEQKYGPSQGRTVLRVVAADPS